MSIYKRLNVPSFLPTIIQKYYAEWKHVHISRDHSFPRAAEFRAEPRNITEFEEIPRNDQIL